MNEQAHQQHDYRFLGWLAMGGVVGAGLALWLAPRAAAEIKERAVDSVRNLGSAASDSYREARSRMAEAANAITRKGQGIRDGVCDTVVRGAQDVERSAQDVQRFATDAKTHPAL